METKLLKNTTRNSLAVAALVAALGLTGCGIGSPDMGMKDGGKGDSKQEQSKAPENPNKPTVWTDHIDKGLALPSDWNEGAGWKTSVKKDTLTTIGDYVAYVDATKNIALVVDSKGDKKYASETKDEFEGDVTNDLRSMKQGGKDYLVIVQSGQAKQDPSSVKKAGPKSIIHVFDAEMNEKWSKTFPSLINLQQDTISIAAPATTGTPVTTASYIDVETGDSKVLNIPAGYNWVARYDGVDIFALIKAAPGKGEITNGVWKVNTISEMGMSSDSTPAPKPFGGMIQVKRPTVNGKDTNKCDIVDPKTGSVFDMGVATGACVTEVFSSSDEKYVYFKGADGTRDGILNIAEKQVFFIGSDIDFKPTAVSNEGLVYGTSGGSVAVFDFKKDTEPKKLQDAQKPPTLLAKNGTAGFDSGYFAVKK